MGAATLGLHGLTVVLRCTRDVLAASFRRSGARLDRAERKPRASEGPGWRLRDLARLRQAQDGVRGRPRRVEPGDVVLALNGTRVSSVEQLRGLAAKSGKHVALLLQRGEARLFVPIDLG